MSIAYQIIVCGSIVPDPLQTLEPVSGPTGPSLKNETMLPSVLDPWAGHALFEAANLAKNAPGSKVWLVSLAPKAKLQQVMMTLAQMQVIAERLGIVDQFQGVDEIKVAADGSFEVLERIEGGKHQISKCAGAPALLGWATGNLPEPKNNPQVGMANMRTVMPALQKAKPIAAGTGGPVFASVALPKQLRETRVVKDAPVDDIARELADWIRS